MQSYNIGLGFSKFHSNNIPVPRENSRLNRTNFNGDQHHERARSISAKVSSPLSQRRTFQARPTARRNDEGEFTHHSRQQTSVSISPGGLWSETIFTMKATKS